MSFSQAATDDWVTRVLDYPVAERRSRNANRIAAARRRMETASQSFADLSGNLGVLDQASALRAADAELRRQFAGLGGGEADVAEGLADTYEQHVARAQEAFDSESTRRRNVLLPLLGQASAQTVDGIRDEIAAGDARLPEARQLKEVADLAAQTISRCKDDPRLGLLGAPAAAFTAAAESLRKAVADLQALAERATEARRAEDTRRADILRPLQTDAASVGQVRSEIAKDDARLPADQGLQKEGDWAAQRVTECGRDPRLDLQSGSASGFDAAAQALREALVLFKGVKDRSLEALRLENQRREAAARTLKEDAQTAHEKLGAAAKAVTEREAAIQQRKGKEAFAKALAINVPGGTEGVQQTLESLASMPGDGLLALSHDEFNEHIDASRRACGNATEHAHQLDALLTAVRNSAAAMNAADKSFKAFKEDAARGEDRDFDLATSALVKAQKSVMVTAQDGKLTDAIRQAQQFKTTVDGAVPAFETARERVAAFNKRAKTIDKALANPVNALRAAATVVQNGVDGGPSAFIAKPELLDLSDRLAASTIGIGKLNVAYRASIDNKAVGRLLTIFQMKQGDAGQNKLARAVYDSRAGATGLMAGDDPSFTKQIEDLNAAVLAVENRGNVSAQATAKRDELENRVKAAMKNHIVVAEAALEAIRAGAEDAQAFLATRAAQLEGVIALLEGHLKQLEATVAAGKKEKGLDLNTFSNTLEGPVREARGVIGAQIGKPDPKAVASAIQAVTDSYKAIAGYCNKRMLMRDSVEKAQRADCPYELRQNLEKSWSDSEASAKGQKLAEADAALDQADRMALIIANNTAMFQELDFAITAAPDQTSKELKQVRATALADAMGWTGNGAAFATGTGIKAIVARLPGAMAEAYQTLKSQLVPNQQTAEAQFKDVSKTLGEIAEKPTAPGDPTALLKRAEADADTRRGGVALRDLQTAQTRIAVLFPRLPYLKAIEALRVARQGNQVQQATVAAELETLVISIRQPADPEGAGAQALGTAEQALNRLAALMPDIAAYAAKWRPRAADYEKELKAAHPKLAAELKTLFDAANGQKFTTAAAAAALDPLFTRIDDAKKMTAGWTGAVPAPVPTGADIAFNQANNAAAALNAVMARINATGGGLTLDDVKAMVPAGANDTWVDSDGYSGGFKFRWRSGGLWLEVRGHGPVPDSTSTNSVAADSPSRKGNIVRVMIGDDYVQNDGATTSNSYTEEGHMPLYGTP